MNPPGTTLVCDPARGGGCSPRHGLGRSRSRRPLRSGAPPDGAPPVRMISLARRCGAGVRRGWRWTARRHGRRQSECRTDPGETDRSIRTRTGTAFRRDRRPQPERSAVKEKPAPSIPIPMATASDGRLAPARRRARGRGGAAAEWPAEGYLGAQRPQFRAGHARAFRRAPAEQVRVLGSWAWRRCCEGRRTAAWPMIVDGRRGAQHDARRFPVSAPQYRSLELNA